MKKLFKSGIFFLLVVLVFSVTALSGSAAQVKKDTVDNVGAILAEEVFEMKVTGDQINLVIGDVMHLTAKVTNVKKQPAIKWSSSDEKVAVVDNVLDLFAKEITVPYKDKPIKYLLEKYCL